MTLDHNRRRRQKKRGSLPHPHSLVAPNRLADRLPRHAILLRQMRRWASRCCRPRRYRFLGLKCKLSQGLTGQHPPLERVLRALADQRTFLLRHGSVDVQQRRSSFRQSGQVHPFDDALSLVDGRELPNRPDNARSRLRASPDSPTARATCRQGPVLESQAAAKKEGIRLPSVIPKPPDRGSELVADPGAGDRAGKADLRLGEGVRSQEVGHRGVWDDVQVPTAQVVVEIFKAQPMIQLLVNAYSTPPPIVQPTRELLPPLEEKSKP